MKLKTKLTQLRRQAKKTGATKELRDKAMAIYRLRAEYITKEDLYLFGILIPLLTWVALLPLNTQLIALITTVITSLVIVDGPLTSNRHRIEDTQLEENLNKSTNEQRNSHPPANGSGHSCLPRRRR